MALINQNSIIGVTSITSPSASNVLTVHTNDTTERLRVSTSGVSFSGTNASLDTSGNLTIAGVLTYEDVTSVDSVGIITAQSGIKVLSGGANITGIVSTNNGLMVGSGPSYLYESGTDAVALRVGSNGPYAEFIDAGSNILELGNASGHLALTSNGTEKVRITSAGLVGIGTTNPGSALEIRTTTTNAATHYRNNASNGGAYFGVRATDLGAASAGEAYVYSYNTGINLIADGTGDINFATGGTASKVRITAAGGVGIGTDIPYVNNSFTSLSIGGSGKYGLIELNKSDGVAGSWIDTYGTNGDGNLRFTTAGTSGAITFWTGGSFTEKVRITNDGRLGIGVTNPQHLLHLKSTGDATLLIQADSDNNGENDNPRILLAQDGSTNGMLELGLIGDPNTPLNNTLANSCYIQANNHVDQPLCLGHMGENVMTIRDGKVGITTHDPQSELHLYSDAPILSVTATNASSGLRVNVRGQTSDSSQLFRVQDDNSTRFTITEDGFMGVANSGSRAPAAPLDVYRETNLTGSAGYVFGTFTHHLGDSGDISRQRSYLDFVFTDANPNFTPQVRIGAQVGWSKGTDQGQPSEGNGSFSVYTGKGNLGTNDGSGTLTERFRVDEDGVVTMSGQVAFEAIRTTDISGGTNGVNLQNKYVTYESESYDIGGNMNLSTGLFTAPVNGIYLFSFGMAIGGGDGGDDSIGVNFRIANNATYYNFTNSNTADFRINPRSITRAGHEHTYTFTKQVRMAEGATCGFYITDWNYASTVLEYAEFCGCKVA